MYETGRSRSLRRRLWIVLVPKACCSRTAGPSVATPCSSRTTGLHYTYNWLGEEEQTISSDRDLPSGPVVLGVSFDKKGNDKQMSALGVVSLFIDDDQVAEGSIKTQPGKFMLGGEGLNIARDPGVPVSPSMYSFAI